MVNDEMKQELLEKYHDINVDHDWWEFLYEDFKAEMLEKGIDIDDISFSGFWSQGDGASFTGKVRSQDMGKFMDAHDLSERYPAARYFCQFDEVWLNLYRTSSHYSHENTVDVSMHDSTGNPYVEGCARWDIYDTMQTLFDTEYAQLELDCEEILRGYMHDLYRRLGKEYEYLTSEDVVWETILANELHVELTN